MSLIDGAKMPTLKDKILEIEMERVLAVEATILDEEKEEESNKKKGRGLKDNKKKK